MTRNRIIDRLNHELEVFGKRAQSALDEGKLQIELLRMKRQRDNTARDLGLLFHQRERTGDAEPRRVDALMFRLDDLGEQITRLEREIASMRSEREREREQASMHDREPATAGAGAGTSTSPGMPDTGLH